MYIAYIFCGKIFLLMKILLINHVNFKSQNTKYTLNVITKFTSKFQVHFLIKTKYTIEDIYKIEKCSRHFNGLKILV